MAQRYTDIDELLARILSGEAAEGDSAQLDAWLAASDDNRRYFESLQRIWANAQPPAAAQFDPEKALQKVKFRLNNSGGSAAARRFYRWPAAAAAAILLLSLAWWLFRSPQPLPAVEIAAGNAVRTDTLADRSVIVLNKTSTLRLAEGYNRRERRMRLSGEARFAVQPDKEKPFVVEVEALEVRVVGTEFTVDALSTPGATTVTVASGIVELRAGGQTLRLLAGEQARYEQTNGTLEKIARPDPNAAAWFDLIFHFDATPLAAVIPSLEKAYGIDIVLENKELANCKLTADYMREKPERILELIALSFSLDLRQEGNRYLLDGPACVE